jgi:hypothetical protein
MTFQDRIPLYVAVFAAILVAIGFAAGVSVGVGAVAGAAVAMANAFALRWLVGAITKADPSKRTSVSLLLMLKTGAILAISAGILFFGHVDPIGFALGIGALVLGLVVGSVHFSLSQPAGLAGKGD